MMLRVLKQYYPIRNLFFIFGETLLIYASVLLGSFIVSKTAIDITDKWLLFKTFLIALIFQTSLYYHDLYNFETSQNFSQFSSRLLQALGFAAIVIAAVYFIFPETIVYSGAFIVSTGLAACFIGIWRFCYIWILNKGLFNQKIILLGSGDLAQKIMTEINARKDCGYEIACIAAESTDDKDLLEADNQFVYCRDKHEGICQLTHELTINKVVVAIKEKRGGLPLKELLRCRVEGIDVIEGTSFYEMLTGKLIVEHINPGWLIFSEGFKKSATVRLIKRIMDVIVSIILFILFLPIMIITAILIKIDSKGPILYSQERMGERRKIYKIHKFRSMIQDAEKRSGPKWADQEDDRITRVGKFIRKWRIDEFPQLWNVIKGEMSFVGPRPEREFFIKGLEHIIPYYGERFIVKPGVTGWAQVNYGYGSSVEDAIEKLNYDLFYIKNMSIFMDIIIILRTVKTVIFGMGR